MLPASVEDEGRAEPGPNHLDIATQTPSTSSVVVLEIENEMLRKENDELKKELEKQKQTFSFSQISSHPDSQLLHWLARYCHCPLFGSPSFQI